jgi:DMSO reductase anchor subunit
MYHLAALYPPIRRVRLPVSRDQIFLLMAAINEIFLGIDIYLAHSISDIIKWNEWIPIIFAPIAGGLLLLAGILALRRRALATLIATVIFLMSIVVGLLGDYFHLMRAILPAAPAGEQVTVNLLVWGPPLLAPLMFALVGLIGISAAWIEDPPDSGILILPGNRRLHLPYSKTRAYFFMIGLGTLATVISSVLDHARTHFANPWLWLPTAAGVLGTVVILGLAALDKPRRGDLAVYLITMLVLIVVGVIGAFLHIGTNLIAEGTILGERFINGAPFLAPLLFSNMGALGLVVLLDPREE